MPVLDADGTTQQIQPPGAGPYLLVNTDTARTVYLGPQRPVTAADVALPPQASVSLDGTLPWYASTLSQGVTVACAVLPSGQGWNNPVGVQAALEALGLAQESTLQALPGNIQNPGVPPAIPNLTSASAIGVPAQAATAFYTFTGKGRLWGGNLSFNITTNASFTGTVRCYAKVRTGSGLDLGVIELGVGSASTETNDSTLLLGGGVPVAANDTLDLDVNGGSSLTQGIMHASVIVGLSMP